MTQQAFIAESADVDARADIGDGSQIWHLAQIREHAHLGERCVVGRGAYVDVGVWVGDHCKIQNHALVYTPARLEDGVFIGPAAVLTNDRFPRAVNADGSPKSTTDWDPQGIVVRRGASIGAKAVVVAGVTIGEWALVGAGAVVTKDVPAHALVVGSPARRIQWVGKSGRVLEEVNGEFKDPGTGARYREVAGALEELE